MINITYRKKIRITHVWFCDDKKYIKSNGDIIFLHGYGTKNSDGIVKCTPLSRQKFLKNKLG